MVQNLPYWNANCTLGHLSLSDLSRFVLDDPVCSLCSSLADFDPILQRPLFSKIQILTGIILPWSAL